MRRSVNGPRSASTAASLAIKQTGSMGRRAVSTDENTNMKGGEPVDFMEDAKPPSFARNGSGPLTDRVKRLEKKFGQVLEMQAKFKIMDKWIQQQFGIKLFPKAVVDSEKFADGNPDDVDNPFYAVYLVIQRMKTLEDKVAKLEARPYEDQPEPSSNYSSAHAFRNIKGKGGNAGGGVKRSYGAHASPSTPKKQKVMPRPVVHSSNYPFKPSVKILPRDPNISSPIKRETDIASPTKSVSPTKTNEPLPAKQQDIKIEVEEPLTTQNDVDKEPEAETNPTAELQIQIGSEDKSADSNQKENASQPSEDGKEGENMGTQEIASEKEGETVTAPSGEIEINASENNSEGKEKSDDLRSAVADGSGSTNIASNIETENTEFITGDVDDPNESQATGDETQAINEDEEIPVLEDSTAGLDEDMEVDSEEDEEDVELKPEIPLEEESITGDVSGSEASVSSLTSASGRHRLSTRRQAAAAAAMSASGKGAEEEKPVMYTARGRRHTVPRRYAEFTGHDNVVSILKSQQRAEKTEGRGPGRPGRKPGTSKVQDTPPKIKKMVKGAKAPTPKKAQPQTDSDGDCEAGTSTSKKKAGSTAPSGDRPECVDALVDRVMAREVDSDGMVVLSEAYPNIYVNQQQLVTVVVRSNGKATRLTRKMTTLVFEDSLLASASPFGTKYYKDRLPPEPLEAMVDFIAASGFEPHYTKKKIYMIVGQVCNEARAGRVSKKFMQPLEATAGPSESQSMEEETTSTPPASPSIPESSSPQ